MRLKTMSVLLAAGLFCLIEPAKADKRYEITIADLTKAGSTELQRGSYTFVVDNSKVRFTELKTGKEFEVEAKIENSTEKKYEVTAIHSKQVVGAILITEIQLGGTKTRVLFP
jgi:hypothetical protein